jgi:hypothetical protein
MKSRTLHVKFNRFTRVWGECGVGFLLQIRFRLVLDNSKFAFKGHSAAADQTGSLHGVGLCKVLWGGCGGRREGREKFLERSFVSLMLLIHAVEEAFKTLSDSVALASHHTPQSLIRWKPSTIAAVVSESTANDMSDTYTWLEEVAHHIPVMYRCRIADIMADITLALSDPVNNCSQRTKEAWAKKLLENSYLLVMRVCPRNDPIAYQNVTSTRKLLQAIETTNICPSYVVVNLSKHLESIPQPAPPPVLVSGGMGAPNGTAGDKKTAGEKRSTSRRKSIKDGPSVSESVKNLFGMTEKEGEMLMEKERSIQKKRRLEYGITGSYMTFQDEFEFTWSRLRKCTDFFEVGMGEPDPC